MELDSILEKSENLATEILSKLPSDFTYHNLEHTKEVVTNIEVIAKEENVSQDEILLLKIAAWFHDTGYSKGSEKHEAESVEIMKRQLEHLEVDEKTIQNLEQIILSTQMPQCPENKLSSILCDADLYHLSSDLFFDKSEALRLEMNHIDKTEVSEDEWLELTLHFMNGHNYHTPFGKTQLEPSKQENIKSLKKSIKKKSKSVKKLEDQIAKLEEKLIKAKTQKPDRGIETMFRITSKNHLQLSAMADSKANIMISINSIILSVLVSVLFRKFGEYPQLIIPALILTTMCLVTIVFAVLATRPNVSSGTFTREEIREKKTNLLFFGNFHGMELDNYMWGMKEMMKDADFLYGSLIKDIYFLGIVLGKKYKMLRKSYNVFMFGFIVSILSFVIALILYPESTI